MVAKRRESRLLRQFIKEMTEAIMIMVLLLILIMAMIRILNHI